MGTWHGGPIPPALSVQTALIVPDGYNLCEQSQMDDLYDNFADKLNQDVVGMEYCYA